MRIKNIIFLVTALIVCMTLVSCKKCISIEHETVPVKILEAIYKPEEVIKKVSTINGKRKTSYTRKPAKYTVTVEYNNNFFTFGNKDYYIKAENKEHSEIKGMLEIKKYDDGSTQEQIIDIFVE